MNVREPGGGACSVFEELNLCKQGAPLQNAENVPLLGASLGAAQMPESFSSSSTPCQEQTLPGETTSPGFNCGAKGFWRNHTWT